MQLSLCGAESYLSLINAVLPLISQRKIVETKAFFFSKRYSRDKRILQRRASVSLGDAIREFDAVIKHDFVSGVLDLRCLVLHQRFVSSGFGY